MCYAARRAAARPTPAARRHRRSQHRQELVRLSRFDMRLRLDAFERRDRSHQVRVAGTRFAILAIAVRRYVEAERVCAKVGDLAEEVDRRFGIAILELAVRR